MASDIDIEISEVGPRDGLQSIDHIMPLKAKKTWVAAEAAAGVPEIEVGSFVPEKNIAAVGTHSRIGRICQKNSQSNPCSPRTEFPRRVTIRAERRHGFAKYDLFASRQSG